MAKAPLWQGTGRLVSGQPHLNHYNDSCREVFCSRGEMEEVWGGTNNTHRYITCELNMG